MIDREIDTRLIAAIIYLCALFLICGIAIGLRLHG